MNLNNFLKFTVIDQYDRMCNELEASLDIDLRQPVQNCKFLHVAIKKLFICRFQLRRTDHVTWLLLFHILLKFHQFSQCMYFLVRATYI